MIRKAENLLVTFVQRKKLFSIYNKIKKFSLKKGQSKIQLRTTLIEVFLKV